MQNPDNQDRALANPKIVINSAKINELLLMKNSNNALIEKLNAQIEHQNVQISQYQRQILDLEDMVKQKFVSMDRNDTIAEELNEVHSVQIGAKEIKNIEQVNEIKKQLQIMRQSGASCNMSYQIDGRMFRF